MHLDSHAPESHDRAFALGVALNLAFIAVEVIAGLSADSLALLADAGHNLSDVLSLLLAWGAAWLARKPASPRRTYGLGRGTILASLINAVVLLVAVGGIAWEALRRLDNPQPVEASLVVAVAAVGVAINTATALLFVRGRGDLNIRGAYLHMAADAAVSLGVVVAALLMAATGALWLDPVISLVIAAVIAVGTWGLLRESLNLSLDAVPQGVDRQAVEAFLAALPGVESVHDLHIWALSTTRVALTVHLVRPEKGCDDAFLAQTQHELHERFGIDHATLQVEEGHCGETC